jgi:hypothetical protein
MDVGSHLPLEKDDLSISIKLSTSLPAVMLTYICRKALEQNPQC